MPEVPSSAADLASLGDSLAALTQSLQAMAARQGSTLHFDYVGLAMFPRAAVESLTRCVEHMVLEGIAQAGHGHGSLFLSVHSWSLSLEQARVTVQFAYTSASGPKDLNKLSAMFRTLSPVSMEESHEMPGMNPDHVVAAFSQGADADCQLHVAPGEGAVIRLGLSLPHAGAQVEPAYLPDLAMLSAWLIGSLSQEESLLATRLQRDGWLVRQFATVQEASSHWASGKEALQPALVIATDQAAVSRRMLIDARSAWTPECRVIYGVRLDDIDEAKEADEGLEIRRVPFSPADLRELKELATTLEARRNRAARPRWREGKRSRPTALVVDDAAVNRILGAEMLNLLGYDCDTAENGREAVEYLERYRADVVLMDIDMPVMDGMEATERIRRYEVHDGGVHKPVTIIATTARDEEDMSRAWEATGMNGFVPKPLLLARLSAALPRDIGCH